jgi:hypothetical protein
MLKEESAVNVNVECSIVGMRQQWEWPSRLNGTDDVSEAEREHRLDESGKAL